MNPKKGKQPSPNKSVFAKRMSDTRRAKGWTQWEFAEMLGVQPTSVVYWETDRRKPRVDILVEIAKLLQVSTDWLLGLDDGGAA